MTTPLLGLLGGMSWTSSLDLYRRINRGVAERRGGLHSANLLLHSVDFAPIAAWQAAGDWEAAACYLGEAGAKLREAGAGALMLATNTMHQVADAVEARAGLPLLHLVDITAAALKAQGVQQVGLLGTRYTMELPFYAERLARHGLRLLVPDAAGRAAVQQAIYEELCRDVVMPATTALLRTEVAHLADAGAQAVVLGCTELGLALPETAEAALPLIDSTRLQAQAAVDWLCTPHNPSLDSNELHAMSSSPWTLAHRAARMNPSIIREILKVTEKPGILSMAGGLPSADTFPVEEIKRACDTVLTQAPREALQYAASEGFAPLREWAAARVKQEVGLDCTPDQVLVTSGSQQGLDLVGKILCDTGAPVAVETPTYLGALQAFTPYEPQFVSLESDSEGPLPDAIRALPSIAPGTRFAYLLPNYQNPTGRVMSNERRDAVMAAAQAAGVPVVEDNPYGDLWFDEPPLPSLASRWSEGSLYLGSFSKILTPGFRLGYLIAPKALYPKLLQAKQAADLHTPGFNQRVVYEVIKDGFLDRHIPTIRARYKANRDAMAEALQQHLPEGCEWQSPKGGMFFWIRLPEGLNAMALLPTAVEANIAFVPGAAFYARDPDPRALRLSFVTLTPAQIREGVAILGKVLNDALNGSHAPTP